MYHVYFHVSMKFKFQKKKLLPELCSTSDPKKEKTELCFSSMGNVLSLFPINVYIEVTGL